MYFPYIGSNATRSEAAPGMMYIADEHSELSVGPGVVNGSHSVEDAVGAIEDSVVAIVTQNRLNTPPTRAKMTGCSWVVKYK